MVCARRLRSDADGASCRADKGLAWVFQASGQALQAILRECLGGSDQVALVFNRSEDQRIHSALADAVGIQKQARSDEFWALRQRGRECDGSDGQW